MKKHLLPTALFAAAAIIPAFAATPTSGEAQNQPAPKTEMSIAALQQMQRTIENDDPIIEELNLDAGWLEDLPPDEQFRDIAGAINLTFTTEQDRRNAIGKVFGDDYVDTMAGTLDSPERIEKVENMLGEAHKLFLSYENRNDVVDWGWGDAWGVTVTPNIGTLGIGIQVGYEFNKYFKVRAHYATGKLDTSIKLEDTNADLMWKNKDNFGVFFDYHPRGSQFHVTAGLIKMDPRIKAEANYHGKSKVEQVVGIDPATETPITQTKAYYKVDDNFIMEGEWDYDVCPYVGIGWSTDGGQARTLYFSIDLGLAYMGEGSYSCNAQHGAASIYKSTDGENWGKPLSKAELAMDHEAQSAANALLTFDNNVREALDDIADFLNDMYVYPVIQIGGGIRF